MTEEDWQAYRGGKIALYHEHQDGARCSYIAHIEDVRFYPHCIHLKLGDSIRNSRNEWHKDPSLSWELMQPIDYDTRVMGENAALFESTALQQTVILRKAA